MCRDTIQEVREATALALWQKWVVADSGNPILYRGGVEKCLFCNRVQRNIHSELHEKDCVYIQARTIVNW